MDKSNASYWTQRYKTGQTGWDAGSITTPLKEYFDQVENKNCKILIPGCGNAYEASYLHNNGFKNVYLVDVSEYPLKNFASNHPDFPKDHILNDDFFALGDTFDLIIEQTFFCALHPSRRQDYAKKAYELLNINGHLAGVLFDDDLYTDKPPYGGHPDEYIKYFKPYFIFHTWERCYNSIKPRAGREWFMNLIKAKSEETDAEV